LALCDKHAIETGALKIHAFEQIETLLGQGSVGLELEEQAPHLDTLLVATGGGGLIGGIAAYLGDRIKVVSVEPELAPTLHDALRAGKPVDAPTGGVAADSLAPRRVGDIMFGIAQRTIKDAMLVPDEAIKQAQALLWDRMRVVAEPGGAAALAALLSARYVRRANERVSVLLCGANTTAVSL
jgi:threonine dehydratase